MRGLALLMLASSGVALRVAPIHLATGRNVATLPLPTMQMVREDETPISAVERKYNESPTDISGINLPVEAIGATDVVLIFHGRGGPDRETDDLKARFISQDAAVGLQRFVDVIDWQSYMEGTDRLSFTGQAIGRKFGRALARQGGLRSIHVVGTSAGAFAANEVCSEYIAITSDRPRANVRLSLTDPFTARGGENLNNGWGLENFGRSADFAEHFLNTDDVVPSTNVPLPYCHVYDVTGCKERKDFPLWGVTGNFLQDVGLLFLGYHNWPMGYMARHYTLELDNLGYVRHPNHMNQPRGQVVRVP